MRLRLETAIAIRLAVAFAGIATAAWMFGGTRLRIVPSVLLAIAALQLIELGWSVRRSASRVAQVLAGWRSNDLSDTDRELSELGFGDLGGALDAVTRSLHDGRAAAEERRLYLEAIVGHAPAPLLVLEGRRIDVANRAARRLFGSAVGSLDDLATAPPTRRRPARSGRSRAPIAASGSTPTASTSSCSTRTRS